MVTRREWVLQCLWWTVILSSALLLKFYYSVAIANDLQWMLRPLASLTETLTGLRFVMDSTGAWVDARNNVAIVKSCAGINFMIMSLFVYATGFQPDNTSPTEVKPAGMAIGLRLLVCLLAAWCATILVNSIRIMVAIEFYLHDLTIAGLTREQMHRMIGVVVYFPALWLQLQLFGRIKKLPTGIVAATLYLGLLLFVPLVTGKYRAQPDLFIEHALGTGGLTIALVVLFSGKLLWLRMKILITALWKSCSLFNKTHITI